jgi:TusA-related sulfurtransferase
MDSLSGSEMSDPGAEPNPDAVCDGGDLDCGSGLLLIIRSAMAPLPGGGVLEVRSRETSVREDLPAWCRMVGHAMLDVRDGEGGYAHYFLRKKAADADLSADLQRAREYVWQARVRWSGGMQAKVTVRNLEVVVKATSANILVFLGVDDADHPGLAGITAIAYVDSDADPTQLETVLADTVRRCPVAQSLLRTVPLDVQCKGT